MEGAIVVTPVESHHSLSVYLSSHGIHNMVETQWCSMVSQAREMIRVAKQHHVIVRVAENFIRFAPDRFALAVRQSGWIGRIGRIFSYNDHTGYHNNSRWLAFAGCHPDWVQCLEHVMFPPAFYFTPERRMDKETLTARFFHFPNDFVVLDTNAGNIKGLLGRHPRPGYTEWQGERGTLVYRNYLRRPDDPATTPQTELRRVPDAHLAPAQEAAGQLSGGGMADEIAPVLLDYEGDCWVGCYAETSAGRIAYHPPLRLAGQKWEKVGIQNWVSVVETVADFVLAVRGLRPSDFTAEDALMSEMMEIGARESALQEGRRIRLPMEGDLESDARERERQRQKFGVDPLDVEAMLSISFPRP